MPVARVFIDSTSFLYTRDRDERPKGDVIAAWLAALVEHQAGVTNLQVLNEVVSVITRKRARFAGLDPFFEADEASTFGAAPLTQEAAFVARAIYARYGFSWWDCLLLASALELGCTHFLSEDMQDGQRVDNDSQSLTLVNPFAHSPGEFLTHH
jgi:predicted nucleic acid-binding protein